MSAEGERELVERLRVDVAMALSDYEWNGTQPWGRKPQSYRDRYLEAADAILALPALTAQAQRIAELTREREEAQDRVEELERDADIVSAEFEKECWRAVRWLLEKVGWTEFSEGVTAQDACEIIWEAIASERRRTHTALSERDTFTRRMEEAAKIALEMSSIADDALSERDTLRVRVGELERPITTQDVRLAVGEGKLTPADVLAGCNAELKRRSRQTLTKLKDPT